jgi:hypothetical protein
MEIRLWLTMNFLLRLWRLLEKKVGITVNLSYKINVMMDLRTPFSYYEGASKVKKDQESSDSDTEVASEDEEEEDGSGEDCSYEEDAQEEEDEEEEDDEYEEEECGGSTTEIETDSEFAEDPPHSVPGSIPTIIVNAPEQLVTRLVDATPINHTHHSQPSKEARTVDKQGHHHHGHHHHQRKITDYCHDEKSIELVKKGGPERQMPVVTAVPKKWEPLLFNNPDRLASIELKKKYLYGNVAQPIGNNQKKSADPAAQTQFKSLLDMISEQQKLLQPASAPSASMQAFLDGHEKMKNQTNLPYLNRNLTSSFHANNMNSTPIPQEKPSELIENSAPIIPKEEISPNNNRDALLHKTGIICNEVHSAEESNDFDRDSLEPVSDCNEMDLEKEVSKHEVKAIDAETDKSVMQFSVTITSTNEDANVPEDFKEDPNVMVLSNDSFSASQSETETRSTVINVIGSNVNEDKEHLSDEDGDSGSDTEVGSGEPLSDLDDLDFEHNPPPIIREPPRVEIEDEFGVTQSLDVASENGKLEVTDCETEEVNNDKESKYIMDLGLSESQGKSSSESSFNSGIFLETEMSEYVKDDESGADPHRGRSKSKKKGKQGSTNRKSRSKKVVLTESSEKPGRVKPSFGFDLEALDFADIDGISSPEDGPIDPVKYIPSLDSHSSTDIAVVASIKTEAALPAKSSSGKIEDSRSTYAATDSLTEDEDDRSSTSDKDPHENSASEADVSENVNFSSTDNVPELGAIPNLKAVAAKESFPHLERVGPFSSARDSLDYRKTKAVTSHLRNKELYSTYAVPSVKGSVVAGELEVEGVWEPPKLEDIGESATSLESSTINTLSDDSNKSTGSPGTTRRLNEIHQERAKQNDLIRSMVLGRIKRSPDKGVRRNSKGSSSGTSLQSHTTVEKSGDEESDSRKSSDNSQGQDGNTSEEYVEDVKKTKKLPQEKGSDGHSSSEEMSANDIPHRPMAESVSSHSEDSSTSRSARILLPAQKAQPTYEPVFTSSPRFRNRPKFDGILKHYQSVTEPPTPTESMLPNYLDPDIINEEKSKGIYSVANPLFFRSMPNLSQEPVVMRRTEKDGLARMEDTKESYSRDAIGIPGSRPPTVEPNATTPSDNQFSPSFDQSTNSYGKPHGLIPSSNSQSFNPFLVQSRTANPSELNSPGYETYSAETPKEPVSDDFINLHLRFRNTDRPSERKTSPEKARSVCTGSLNSYGDSGYYAGSVSTTASSPPRHTVGPRYPAEENWILEKHENMGRPRANTLTDLHFKENPTIPMTQRASVSFVDERNNPQSSQGPRHVNDYSEVSTKPPKSKALSSDTLLDGSPLSENSCRVTSVPDISSTDNNQEPSKQRKGKDRDRRRSLIQTVSDFFRPNNTFDKSPSSGGQSLTTSVSSSSIISPSKDKFSLFKLTPKLLQTKDKKNSQKSRECVVSPSSQPTTSGGNKYRMDSVGDSNGCKSKTDFSAYFAQPNVAIQRMSSSPNPPAKPERVMNFPGNVKRSSAPDFDFCAQNMATLSIVANSGREKSRQEKPPIDYRRNEAKR